MSHPDPLHDPENELEDDIIHSEFPVVLQETVAGTVWIMPNEKGGMTVMKPEDY